jgi:hypothetical protein
MNKPVLFLNFFWSAKRVDMAMLRDNPIPVVKICK